MSGLIILSIFFNLIIDSNSIYVGERAKYLSPKLERNNVLNKGLWTKDRIEKSNYGDFIFRADSGDVDNLLQNNFDAFGENYMDTIPVFSSYVERNKRSTIHKQKQRHRKSLKKCEDKLNCKMDDDETLFKSKVISNLRPASVFNDYPYEVAVLLANSSKREIASINKSNNDKNNYADNNKTENVISIVLNEQNKTMTPSTNNNTNKIIPKRRMISDLESETMKDLKIEVKNKTKHIDGSKIQRNVFDKEDRMWQGSPIQSMVIPRPETSVKNKPVTEKGLVKILSLLTKTFRKVMKQHNEMQEVDNKLRNLHEDFMKNVAVLESKFEDFHAKYSHLLKINGEAQQLNDRLKQLNERFETKETEMSRNFMEFENQQKKFLAQQRQFYAIQKFMLEQNEKINLKQSMIAKTQSEISHRQNHFARILKKAKQYYLDTKLPGTFIMKNKNASRPKVEDSQQVPHTTPSTHTTTDSVKINLFSIPNIEPLIINHDKLILKEKHDHTVDDLVYKYYFNNTFIDQLMKSKFLGAIINSEGKNMRNIKNKRNELTGQATVLVPVDNTKDSSITGNNHRERRWIKYWNKSTKKYQTNKVLTEDMKKKIDLEKEKSDPYQAMATNFCIQIGQNANTQMLNWCIEKSLRRLKSIDLKSSINSKPTPTEDKVVPHRVNKVDDAVETTKLHPLESSTLGAETIISTPLQPSSPAILRGATGRVRATEKVPLFFPDNDELESKIKQFELQPDPEGTVYFDGSLHTSAIAISESDALSDIMPGLDSDSRVDLDPRAIDLQAKRRAYVRRLNENILKMNG